VRKEDADRGGCGCVSGLFVAASDVVWRLLRTGRCNWADGARGASAPIGNFAAKVADIFSLYLNSPEHGLVLSVEEKPTIQALERARRYVLISRSKFVQGLKSTYKRHGPVNLSAALEVATDVILGKTTQTRKHVDSQAFMIGLVAEHPPDREIHVIPDKLSTHKKNEEWRPHPNVTFHCTPTAASWLKPSRDLVWPIHRESSRRRQLCQRRAAHPSDPRFHRSLQPERRLLRLAQVPGQDSSCGILSLTYAIRLLVQRIRLQTHPRTSP
jgi:DDE superfamily endonuclease